MSCEFGKMIRVSVFGQSHGAAVGTVISGLPAGERIDMERVLAFMRRRAPGGSLATPRKEKDIPHILSGLVEDVTCGAPLCAVIDNENTRSADYDALRDNPRPMHADYPAHVKYGGFNDVRGGGHFSARLTAALCFAGAVCLQLLEKRGVQLGARLRSVENVSDTPFDPLMCDPSVFDTLFERRPPVLDLQAGERMLSAIARAREEMDSVGGVIELCAVGLPVGLGEPPFDGVENRLSQALYAVPAVKAIDFGAGHEAAYMRGSAHNDAYRMQEGRVTTATNRHGGILGGLTTGMPLLLRCYIKPTPSIAREQDTVSLKNMENAVLSVQGRHDPCAALRAAPCVEAAAAIALLDMYLEGKAYGIE